jgi:hypothetical protein
MGVNAVMIRKMLQNVTCESALCEESVEERGGGRGRRSGSPSVSPAGLRCGGAQGRIVQTNMFI